MTLSDTKTKVGTAQASRALLPRWANDQDGWSRTIAADVLKNRVQPSDLDIDRYLKLLMSEKKLSEEPFQTVPKIEEKQLTGNSLEAVRLDFLARRERRMVCRRGRPGRLGQCRFYLRRSE